MIGIGLGAVTVAIQGRRGGAEWLPTSAAGTLHAWWDASEGLNTSGTTVTSWLDRSGNERTLTPTSMSTDTAQFGGAAVPRMQAGAVFTRTGLVTPYTAFFVWSQDATITASSPAVRLAATSTSGSGEHIGTGAVNSFLTGEILCFADNTAQIRGASATSLPSGVSAGGHILATRYMPFDIGIFLDGGPDIQDLGSGGNTPNWDTGSTLRIGEATGAATGHLAEVLLYETTLSLDDVDRVTGYLAHKWGLEGNLPAEHPYKSSPPS